MSYKDDLLNAVNKYSQDTGRAASGVGLAILNDSKFFDRIKAGAGCTMETYEKVMLWFQENAPKTKSKKHRTQ